jgi:cytochrome b/mono/diheme cytochrome c family protein
MTAAVSLSPALSPVASSPVRRSATPWRLTFLLGFHALLAGAFVVAWMSGDEDTYRIHLVAGYAAIIALTARVAAGLLSPKGVLAWPKPSRAAAVAWIKAVAAGDRGARGRRSPLLNWAAVILLATVGAAALSGLAADFFPIMEDPHEFFADLALVAVIAHVVLMLGLAALKKAAGRVGGGVAGALLLCLVALGAPDPAAAQSPQQRILADYAGQARAADPAFTAFSAERGQALYRGPHTGGKAETPACAACHTAEPRNTGRHVSTGRDIPPMALSANPKRFTDAADVEKRFSRDCPGVLGRPCTAQEKGDFITYLLSR